MKFRSGSVLINPKFNWQIFWKGDYLECGTVYPPIIWRSFKSTTAKFLYRVSTYGSNITANLWYRYYLFKYAKYAHIVLLFACFGHEKLFIMYLLPTDNSFLTFWLTWTLLSIWPVPASANTISASPKKWNNGIMTAFYHLIVYF